MCFIMKKPSSVVSIFGIVFSLLGPFFYIAGLLSKYKILKTSINSKGDPAELFPIFGIIFFISGGLLISYTKINDIIRNKIKETGYKISGEITKIKELKYTHYGNRSQNPFVIYYTYVYDGIRYKNKSHLLWDRNTTFNVGDNLSVYVNKKNIKQSILSL